MLLLLMAGLNVLLTDTVKPLGTFVINIWFASGQQGLITFTLTNFFKHITVAKDNNWANCSNCAFSSYYLAQLNGHMTINIREFLSKAHPMHNLIFKLNHQSPHIFKINSCGIFIPINFNFASLNCGPLLVNGRNFKDIA
jgi:hypothetical protein